MKKNAWDVRVFNNLYKQNPKEAFIYRKNTLGDEIPEEYRKNSSKKNDKKFSREDLIALLEKNNINYVKNSKDETLLKKCMENNLI